MALIQFKMAEIEIEQKTGRYTIRCVGPNPNGEDENLTITPDDNGRPIITNEATLAFHTPTDVEYFDHKGGPIIPRGRISKIVCQNYLCISLSGAKLQKVEIKPNNDGSIMIGKSQWWIRTLLSRDTSFTNYTAYCSQVRPIAIRVVKADDLDLFS